MLHRRTHLMGDSAAQKSSAAGPREGFLVSGRERTVAPDAPVADGAASVLGGVPSVDRATPATDGDYDPVETREWIESFEGVVRRDGRERGLFLLKQLEQQAQELG